MKADKASVVVFVSRLLISAVGFVATAYFAQVLGPGALGVYFTFEAVLNVLGLFSVLGVDSGVEKRISESEGRKGAIYLGGAFLLVALSLGAILLIALALQNHINTYVGIEAVPALLFGLLFGNFSRLTLNTIRAEQRIATTSVIELLGECTRVVASLILYTKGMGPASLLYGLVLGHAFRLFVSTFLVRTGLAIPDVETVKSLFQFSKYSLAGNVGGLIYNWSDTLILSLLVVKASVGIYESAWRISVVALLAGQTVGSVLFPTVSRWHASGELGKIENAFTEGVLYSTLLVVPAVVGGAIVGDELMHVVYGFNSGGLILIVLLSATVPQVASQVASNTLLGVDRPRQIFRINVVSAIINIVLNFTFIHWFGPIGAAVSTFLVSLLSSVLYVWYLRDTITVRFDKRGHYWQFGASFVMGGGVILTSWLVPTETLWGLLLTIATGIVLYGIGILVNSRFRCRLRSLVTE